MTIQVVSGVPSRTPDENAEIEPYDFARPTRLPREQSAELLRGMDTFARSWATELSSKLRTDCHVAVLGVSLHSYDDYIGGLPESAAMILLSMDTVLARGVMQFPLQDALGWAERMFGGAGSGHIPERPFSPIEQALITKVVSGALATMAYSLGAGFPQNMKVDRIEYTPQAAKAAGPTDATIITSLELTVDGSTSLITFALPADALVREGNELSHASEDEPLDLMLAHLAGVPVRVSLQFQPTRVRPEVVLGLAEGDLIRMTHSKNRPLNFAVEGHVMAKAAVGASGSQLACVIVDTQETP
ncbi:MAG: flagellar motor switch protein FliM [Salinibacterium sp.]|nr:flagellar motor switch protein FliM [Salinibacterium sp.]